MSIHLIYGAAILVIIAFFLLCLHRKNKELLATRRHLGMWMKRYHEFWEQSHVKTADEWMQINAVNAGRVRYQDARIAELEEENKTLRSLTDSARDRFKEFAFAAFGAHRGTFKDLLEWIEKHKEPKNDLSQNPS